MDKLVLTARYRTYLLKVTYSFGDDLLNVEWGDVQGEPMLLLALPQARERLLFILRRSGTVARRAIILTTTFIRRLGILAAPIGPKCVLFQTTLREDDEESFKKFVESKELEIKLQSVFENLESYLREELGDDYGSLEEGVIAGLKKVKIVSVDLCEAEEAESTFRDFREPIKPAAPQSLDEVVDQVIGKLGEESKHALNSKFDALGIKTPKHLRHLQKENIAAELSGALKLAEIQELIEYATGKDRPFPPVNLRLSSPEYRNTALTVFFDDPNKITCDYVVTALDMESGDEFPVESSSNFGVLKDLKPGRRYVIYAQCVSNDVRSKKTFFGEPINVYGRVAIPGEEPPVYPTKMMQSVQSVPSARDSAYMSETRGRAKRGKLSDETGPVGDEISVAATQSDVQLGDEAATIHSTKKKDPRRIWETPIHDEMKKVFPEMSKPDMKNLLKKMEEMGIQTPDDLRYLETRDVADELKGTLKIVELTKLLAFVREGTYWNYDILHQPPYYGFRVPEATKMTHPVHATTGDVIQALGGSYHVEESVKERKIEQKEISKAHL